MDIILENIKRFLGNVNTIFTRRYLIFLLKALRDTIYYNTNKVKSSANDTLVEFLQRFLLTKHFTTEGEMYARGIDKRVYIIGVHHPNPAVQFIINVTGSNIEGTDFMLTYICVIIPAIYLN